MDEDAAGEDAAGEDAASEDAASEDAADEGAAVPQMNKSLPVHDKTTPKRSPSSDMWTTPPSSLKSLASKNQFYTVLSDHPLIRPLQ